MRVLVLGATGMLGNAMVRVLSQDQGIVVIGVARSNDANKYFPGIDAEFIGSIDAANPDSLADAVAKSSPDVIINCVGLIKQVSDANSVMASIPINTLLPHRLERLAQSAGARLVHVSTDCVFSGRRGMYLEADRADATDVYGLSKLLGEVDAPHVITLRTSIIGHEVRGGFSLLEWFLAQKGGVKGFTRAVFSGLTTIELARVIRDYVLQRDDLAGLYHVSSEPISKFDLLRVISSQYHKDVEIIPDDTLAIDRSLNSERFRQATGYKPPSWPDLITEMYAFEAAFHKGSF